MTLVQQTKGRLWRFKTKPWQFHRFSQPAYIRWRRKLNRQLGLTFEGKPRKNKQRHGLSKDHTAYMRVWRRERKLA